VLAAAAVSAGVCDILCSDDLPAALQTAPHILARNGVAPLARTVDLVSVNPAAALGLPSPAIDVGAPLTAALQQVSTGGAPVGLALWRDGRLVFSRTRSGARAEPAR
jgi:alpha-D-ribose 1-methylphosphonate 5-triphosphate diphosphatase